MIKNEYIEYAMNLESGLTLRVTMLLAAKVVTFQVVYANGEFSDDVITVANDKFSELAEIVNDIKAGL